MIVYSFVYGRADMIEYQVRCFARFVLCGFRFVVVNSGPDAGAVRDASNAAGVERIDVPHSHAMGSGSDGHAHALNWCWRQQLADRQNTLFIDMDVFPIRPTRPTDWFRAHLAGWIQSKGDSHYLWPGLLFIRRDMPDSPLFDFDPGVFNDVRYDTGGKIHQHIQEHGVSVDYLTGQPHLIDGAWFHHGGASNWMRHAPDHENQRWEATRAMLDGVLK